jgi:uncharacterized surface protein with fasciclin (FAS1) repeats
MKLVSSLLPLAALTSAFVVPDQQITEQLALQSQKEPQSYFNRFQGSVEEAWSGVEDTFNNAVAFSENALDNAINAVSGAANEAKAKFECHMSMEKWDIQGWLDSAASTIEDVDIFETSRPHDPHHKPHHGHHAPNKTVYELITSSKYTTKFAQLIDEYPDLVKTLNGTAANYTVFAPTNKAFEKIPEHGRKPSKELLKKVLAYHISPDFYPAGRVLVSHTIPTVVDEGSLGGVAQRLRVGLSLKGLLVNFYSKVVAINIVRPLCIPKRNSILTGHSLALMV